MSWIGRGIRLAIGASLVIGTVALAVAAWRVVLLVVVAVILAAGLKPVTAWLRRRLGVARGAAVLLVYGAFLVVVVGFAFVVLPVAAAQLVAATGAIPAFLDRVREWAEGLQPQTLALSVGRLADAAERLVAPGGPTGPTTGQVVEVGLTLAEALVTMLTLLTVVYYWLVEHARLQRYVLAFVPARRRAGARSTWNAVEGRLGLWVRGQLILMGTIGLATGAACAILGVPGAVVLGLISALTEVIPLVGPLLGAIPAILMAATISPELALAVAGVYLVIQLVEGNVLVPLVMRNAVGVSPFLIILSLLIGGAVGGIPGALLAVPIVAAVELIIEDLQARERPIAQDPAAQDPVDVEPRDDGRPAGEPSSTIPAPAKAPAPVLSVADEVTPG